jgi:cytochrome b subunit of formate dehydrogenase
MFWAIMIPIILITITGAIVGEERFNRWFKCKHKWQCLNSDGEIDNENPVRIVCKKCGRNSDVENK